MYDTDGILDAVLAGVAAREQALRAEQAVYGLDALDEVAWHPLAAAALVGTGLGVLREQVYPQEWRRKDRPAGPAGEGAAAEGLPRPRDRQRCDLVLTPGPGLSLRDPLAVERGRRSARREAAGLLFEARALLELGSSAEQTGEVPGAVEPAEAYWLEVKVVAQHSYSGGVPGPNPSYAGELVRGITADARKLASDELIVHAGLLLVLFTEDRAVASHDLVAAVHRCLDRSVPVGSPLRREVEVGDRIGNRLCTLSLLPVRK